MKPRTLYSLIVRFAGIAGMMYLIRHWGYYWHKHHTLWGAHRWEMIFEVVLFLIGIYMAIGIPILMELIAPKDWNDKDKSDSSRR